MKMSSKNTIKLRKHDLIEYWSVLWIILFSGSLYFQILRIELSLIITLVTVGVLLVGGWKISRINFKITLFLCTLVLLNLFLNLKNGFNLNGMIILFTRFLFLIIVQSNIVFSDFKKKYTHLMTFEALISLICFLWVDILEIGELPFQNYTPGETFGYYLTPYYTVGWSQVPIFYRNAGLFLEPGVHQIFLNFALIFLLSDENRLQMKKKQYIITMTILVVAVLTTQSTTGYVCLFVVFLSNFFLQNKKNVSKKEKRMRKLTYFATTLCVVILFFIEKSTGVIATKLGGGGSYTTRANDSVIGYILALSRPIVGYGLFNTQTTEILKLYGVVNISNGMANFLIGSGLILGAGLLIFTFKGIKKQFNRGILFAVFIFAFYLLSINSEGGVLNPLYLTFLFCWKREKLNVAEHE